jgi:hypothetical protein
MSDKMMENLPNPPKYSPVVDATDDKHTLIRIDDGEYAGFVIKYNSIKFDDTENEDGFTTLKYDYDIMSSPSELVTDEQKQAFEHVTATIIYNIILTSIEINNENRNDNTVSPSV